MTIGDKIIMLRRRRGWSQEEFAEKIGVSRQAVSKWESGQSNPELEKILIISEIFGVTTDYLLKDDISDNTDGEEQAGCEIRYVQRGEAEEYTEQRSHAARRISLATVLCMLSPLTLIVLAAMSEMEYMSEIFACGVGIAVLVLMVLTAVPIFIWCGFKNSPYEYLRDGTPFRLTADAGEYVKGERERHSRKYELLNILATRLCIFSPIPLIICSFLDNDFLSIIMVCVLLILASSGVYMFIYAGVVRASYDALLQTGDFSPSDKGSGAALSAYWGIVVAVYLLWSFLSNDWHITWLVFVVGGALSPVVSAIFNRKGKDKR